MTSKEIRTHTHVHVTNKNRTPNHAGKLTAKYCYTFIYFCSVRTAKYLARLTKILAYIGIMFLLELIFKAICTSRTRTVLYIMDRNWKKRENPPRSSDFSTVLYIFYST